MTAPERRMRDYLRNTMPRLRDVATGGPPDRLDQLRDSLEQARTGTYRGAAGPDADDDRVVADVDGDGRLVNLEISPYGFKEFDGVQLGEACTQALGAAREALAEHLRTAIDLSSIGVDLASLPDLPTFAGPDDLIDQAREVAEEWDRE